MPVYFLELDNKNPGFDAHTFESSVFSDASNELMAIEKLLRIKNHFELFSYAGQNSLCPPGYEETKVPWFEAQMGIDWVGKVVAYLRANPASMKKSERLIADLEQCAAVLEKAREIGAKWHFCMDV